MNDASEMLEFATARGTPELNGVQEVVGSNPAGPRLQIQTNVFHVYVLRSVKTGRHYVGSCRDLDDRIRRHTAGHSKATRHGIPGSLVKKENFSTRAEAVRRELYFKTGRGRDELAALNL